jgi:glucose-1-phosphate thymidylyltransferase
MKHDNDVGAQFERLAVAGFLIGAVAPVCRVLQNFERIDRSQALGNFESGVLGGIIDKHENIYDTLGDLGKGFLESLGGIVGGKDTNDPFAVEHGISKQRALAISNLCPYDSSMGNSCKGIILAGGKSSRLYPLTQVLSKQLLAVYDKPMIYYPLSTLMLAGIREILVICRPEEIEVFRELLGDGSRWGISLCYATQETPRGLPDAFIVGEAFIGQSRVALILGDNFFCGQSLRELFAKMLLQTGASLFAYRSAHPGDYGVVEFSESGEILSIEEKPQHPKSHWVLPGFYFFDADVCAVAKSLKASSRGELEIVDLHRHYLKQGNLKVETLGRGSTWLDMGTPDDLLQAALLLESIEKRQGLKIGSPEEMAYRMAYINRAQLEKVIAEMPSCAYARYLKDLSHEKS